MIRLENISLQLGDRKVLDHVTLSAGNGETKVVLGPSGAGKSTLLKVILGLIRPDTGRVWIDGQETTYLREQEILPIRRKIGVVFQANALFDSLTVAENITFFLRENGTENEATLANVVQEQLECCNLGNIGHLYPEELSGGMRKRVAIARALAVNPSIILYDEPTTGLDPINAKMIRELIKKLQRQKAVTSMVVTHVLRDAFAIADSLVMMQEGRVIFDGIADDLRSSDDPFFREFLYHPLQT